jgi:ribosomal-protein-alanine N-acetyltransferase
MTRGRLVLEAGRREDLAAVLLLERLTSPHPWTEAHCAAALEGGEGAERTLVLRAPLDPQIGIVGFCVLAVISAAGEAEVRNVAVHPASRRLGLARLLIETAVGLTGAAGARSAFLEVREGNAAARALYSRLGFVETGRRPGYYAEPREDAVLMALTLPRARVDSLGGLRYPSSAT